MSDEVNITLAALSARLDALAARNETLEAEVRQLRSQFAAGEPDEAREPFAAPSSRRSFFAKAAVVAGAAAVGAGSIVRPAAAVEEPILLGASNGGAGTRTTWISASVSVLDGGDNRLASTFGAMNDHPTVGTGVYGKGTSYGTVGLSTNGTGVFGQASGDETEPHFFATGVAGYIDNLNGGSARGVAGRADGVTQTGVDGSSDAGVGVRGSSYSGTGGLFQSTGGVAGSFNGGYADLSLGGLRTTRPSTDITKHLWGDIVMQSDGTLWMCHTTGTPGGWRRLGGRNTAGALTVLPLPVRVYDSRVGKLPSIGTKAPLRAGVDRGPIDCKANGSTVPFDASAVLLTVIATGQTAKGAIAVRSGVAAYRDAQNLHWSAAGQTTAASVTVPVAAGALIRMRLSGATGSKADVKVNVVGYYR